MNKLCLLETGLLVKTPPALGFGTDLYETGSVAIETTNECIAVHAVVISYNEKATRNCCKNNNEETTVFKLKMCMKKRLFSVSKCAQQFKSLQ